MVPKGGVRIVLGTAHAAAPAADPATPPAWTTLPRERTALFGSPGAQALLSIACEGRSEGSPQLIVTRYAPAERGAEALFAIQGNRRILRLPVRAIGLGGGVRAWRGALYAGDERADVFLGPEIAATVPGGGRLAMPAMDEARRVIDECRGAAAPIPTAPGLAPPAASPEAPLDGRVRPGQT